MANWFSFCLSASSPHPIVIVAIVVVVAVVVVVDKAEDRVCRTVDNAPSRGSHVQQLLKNQTVEKWQRKFKEIVAPDLNIKNGFMALIAINKNTARDSFAKFRIE